MNEPQPERPDSIARLGELVREAKSAGSGLFPRGGGTYSELGLPPSKSGRTVSLNHFDSVLDYPARDMTITTQAGISLRKLQQTLAAEGQRLAIDNPRENEGTLGGALAVNQSGPRRFGFGTLRDAVIGISFLTDEGIEVKAGGRVVKNVAGYDLMKLQIGALGTLGIITQVTLKVTPKPEAQALVAFGLTAASVGPTLDRLHSSNSRPVAVELLNASAAKTLGSLPASDSWVIVAGFEEKKSTVAWQVQTLKDELKTAPVRDLTEWHGPACEPIWNGLTALQDRPVSRLSLKANVLPSRLAGYCTEAAGAHPDFLVQAHALNGIAFLHVEEPELTAERASGLVANLLPKESGNLTVRQCPAEWKKVLPVWGRPTGDRELMRSVKKALDPHGVFNPGRLLGE